LTKTEFEKLLLDEGYVCEQGSQYPSVIVYDSKDVKTVSKKVRALCKKCGYESSFAVRSFREGIKTYPQNTKAEDNVAEVIDIENGEQQEKTAAVSA
jgi:transcription elongation factor Elf1